MDSSLLSFDYLQSIPGITTIFLSGRFRAEHLGKINTFLEKNPHHAKRFKIRGSFNSCLLFGNLLDVKNVLDCFADLQIEISVKLQSINSVIDTDTTFDEVKLQNAVNDLPEELEQVGLRMEKRENAVSYIIKGSRSAAFLFPSGKVLFSTHENDHITFQNNVIKCISTCNFTGKIEK